MKLVYLFAFVMITSCTHHSALDDCRKEPTKCEAIDIDDSDAQSAYQFGCDAKLANSCYRLGQLFENKSSKANDSIKAYELSCTFGNNEGCEDAKDLRAKLCYFDKKTEFCKGEPEGEYRIFVFLENFDAKYQDAFIEHDFSNGFGNESVEDLYLSRLKERNKKLLAALELAKQKGHHDGDDAETLERDIQRVLGKASSLDED